MEANGDLLPQGTLSLPVDVLKKLAIRPGDKLQLAELGGVVVRAEVAPSVTELALEIERAIIKSGLTMEELLDSLYEERERYTRERYGSRA